MSLSSAQISSQLISSLHLLSPFLPLIPSETAVVVASLLRSGKQTNILQVLSTVSFLAELVHPALVVPLEILKCLLKLWELRKKRGRTPIKDIADIRSFLVTPNIANVLSAIRPLLYLILYHYRKKMAFFISLSLDTAIILFKPPHSSIPDPNLYNYLLREPAWTDITKNALDTLTRKAPFPLSILTDVAQGYVPLVEKYWYYKNPA